MASFVELIPICYNRWSSQVKYLVVAAIINVIWVIRFCRNQNQFNNASVSLWRAKHLVISAVSLSDAASKGNMSSSISEFRILKFFSVAGHPPKAPIIKQVDWNPPLRG